MKAAEYYRYWTNTDPTPEQVALFDSKKHGYFGGWNPEKFLATLVLAMNMTYDSEHEVYRNVMFAYPKNLEKAVLRGIETILAGFSKNISLTPNDQLREKLKKHIREAMGHINLGSRVFATKEAPTYWVAYGFEKESLMPPWIKEGLL
jgi:hypothetical protein